MVGHSKFYNSRFQWSGVFSGHPVHRSCTPYSVIAVPFAALGSHGVCSKSNEGNTSCMFNKLLLQDQRGPLAPKLGEEL